MTEVPDSATQDNKQPEAPPQVASSRLPVIAVSLAALAVIGATVASVPSFSRSALPVFKQLFSQSDDQSADFSRFSSPKPKRVAATPPAPILVPDPVVRAGLRDIQQSEQQNADALQKNADALAALTQSSATQQADLKRVTRQLALLTAQVNSLQNQAPQPLTTSSIGGPLTTSSIPRPNPRTRVVHASRRVPPPVVAPPAVVPAAAAPTLPKPVGPFSVGGAPLSPPPAPGSGAS
ncbi:MAG: hypothetical protein K2X57_10070 [Xanthobacteraceae bacterium]|nr:hypothetical protein [Xanthobacteraceae bacterium]